MGDSVMKFTTFFGQRIPVFYLRFTLALEYFHLMWLPYLFSGAVYDLLAFYYVTNPAFLYFHWRNRWTLLLLCQFLRNFAWLWGLSLVASLGWLAVRRNSASTSTLSLLLCAGSLSVQLVLFVFSMVTRTIPLIKQNGVKQLARLDGGAAADLPLVSALCLTRKRVHFLRRAMDDFFAQSYRNKELVVAADRDDEATLRHLDLYKDDARVTVVLCSGAESVGVKRNMAVDGCHGQFFVQWDDDDRYAPERMERQMSAIREYGADGSALFRVQCELGDQLILSYPKFNPFWEQSMMVRTALGRRHPFPDLSRHEDTEACTQIVKHGRIVLLDAPELYRYRLHAGNTSHNTHFEATLFLCLVYSSTANKGLREISFGDQKVSRDRWPGEESVPCGWWDFTWGATQSLSRTAALILLVLGTQCIVTVCAVSFLLE